MILPDMYQYDPNYQKGVDDGFEIAQDYFKDELKKFYKEIKNGRLKRNATSSTKTITQDYWEENFDRRFVAKEYSDDKKTPVVGANPKDIKDFIRKLLKEH